MPDPYREPTKDEPQAVRELNEMPAQAEAKERPAGPEKPPAEPSQEQAPSPSTGGQPAGVLVAPSTSAPSQTASALGADLENDRQLKILVDLAFSQGIDKAVSAARASENPYLIDKFHDTLVDELRQKLVDQGKLKTG